MRMKEIFGTLYVDGLSNATLYVDGLSNDTLSMRV